MALEDLCAKQTSEIVQLNRLVGFLEVAKKPTTFVNSFNYQSDMFQLPLTGATVQA